ITVQGNTILDTVDHWTIVNGNQGAMILYDNVIRTLPGNAVSPVVDNEGTDSDLIAVGNTFTTANWIYNPYGRVADIGRNTVSASTVNPSEPILPGTEPNYHRQVFEIPLGANAVTIQQAINNAAAQNGNRP